MLLSQDLNVCTTIHEVVAELFKKEFEIVYKNRYLSYVDITCTLDIETTNTQEDGFLYTIQGNIGGVDFLFRYIEYFIQLVDIIAKEFELSTKRRLVFYIHNLGYEHVYLTQILNNAWGIDDYLLVKSRKPLYIVYNNHVEFRDSLRLFQKSLSAATRGCSHEKMAGDLDYTVYRTPDTELTQKEIDYCVNDVQGLWEAIERFKAQHGFNQATIPYTNTGLVIRELNKHISKDSKCMKIINDLVLDRHQMYLAYKCMAGGDTHGARWYAGRTLENCNSYDYKSAHPSQQLLDKFPKGPIIDMPGDLYEDDLQDLIDSEMGFLGKFFISDFQIKAECPDPTISMSKIDEIEGCTGTDNGRCLGADGCTVFMDSNDLKRFRRAYNYKLIVGIDIIAFSLEYLPSSFRNAIKGWFVKKENLGKDNPDYMFSKICINTIFGACAQKTIRDNYNFTIDNNNNICYNKTGWEDNLLSSSEDEIKKSQKNKLPFLWGLWTSSLSRLDLFDLIETIGFDRAVYWDTDSCKYIGEKPADKVDELNATIQRKCRERDAVITNRNGKEVFIGTAEDEYKTVAYGYKKFRFLHAKCYAAEAWNEKEGEYELETTIAGVGKAEGQAGLGSIENLRDSFEIDPAGGQKLYYHERPITQCYDFNRETVKASWVYMEPRTYIINDAERSGMLEERDQEIIGG